MPATKTAHGATLQELLDTVVAHAPVVLFAFDSDGVFTHCEGRGLEVLGRHSGESVGKSVWDVYAEHSAVLDTCRRALKGETFTAIVPIGQATFEVHYAPQLDWGGKVTGVLGVATDVSETYRATLAKDEFLSLISHELRSPLSSASGWAWMLREGGLSAAESAKAIETVCRNLDELKRLIQELRDAARAATGRLTLTLKACDLGAAVREAARSVAPAARAKGQRLDVAARALPARADKARVRQIASILLSNAIKYSPKGATIRVLLEKVGAEAVLTVSDEGPGLPASLRPQVFDLARLPAADQPPRGRGLMLGLPVARRLTELHGGTIEFADADKRGTIFTVRLPLSSKKPKKRSP